MSGPEVVPKYTRAERRLATATVNRHRASCIVNPYSLQPTPYNLQPTTYYLLPIFPL
ncbi:MAG: hypothetical protein MJZ64_05640 [Paludibacteraceae bacterium]|nr:hypothetical protein [Paludibacteraceae bacterium]